MSLISRRMVGDLELVILTDGGTEFGYEIFPDIEVETIDKLLSLAGKKSIETNFNAMLVISGDKTILVDAGARDLFGDAGGNLPDALAESGVSPESVSTLICTHLHPDHIGGAISADGKAVFSNAELVVTEIERAHWMNDGNFSGAEEPFVSWRQAALDTLDAYGDRLRLLSPNGGISSELSFVAMPGHTPGHAGIRIESNGEHFIYGADIFNAADLQFADPGICAKFDLDPDQAAKSRKRVFDMLASEKLDFSGGHMLNRAVGILERINGGGYRFIPK